MLLIPFFPHIGLGAILLSIFFLIYTLVRNQTKAADAAAQRDKQIIDLLASIQKQLE